MFPLKSPGVVSVSRTHHNLHSEISSKKDNENTRARLQTVSRSTRLLTQSGRETNKINNALINHEIKYRCGTVALFFVFFLHCIAASVSAAASSSLTTGIIQKIYM